MAIDLEEYARGIEAQLVDLRKYLEPLESGQMQLRSNDGTGWKDTTAETIEFDKGVIATYEAILEDVRSRIKRGS
jgi:hypothetical protein